jgi:Icc-related predicted phosphoesterase
MEISLVSDLHIDFDKAHKLDLPGGEILLIAGDLCEIGTINPEYEIAQMENPEYEIAQMGTQYADKLREVSLGTLTRLKTQLSKYDKVFSVLGNHEHYGCDFDATAALYKAVLPEVTLLNNTFVELKPGLRLFGGTMWTDLSRNFPLLELQSRTWSDYTEIHAGSSKNRITVEDTLQEFRFTIEKLTRLLKEYKEDEFIVMTHHLPSTLSVPDRFKHDLTSGFYASSLEYLILDNPNIKVWAHGHTHDSMDYTIGDCRVLCNPRGYYPYGINSKTTITFEV